MTARARRPSRARKLAAAALASIVALVGGELALRAWLAIGSDGYSADGVRREIRALVDQMESPVPSDPTRPLEDGVPPSRAKHVVHPYFGFDLEDSARLVREQERLYRAGVPPEAFVVLVVGGSVATQTAERARDAILEVLASDPRLGGRDIRIADHGRGSHKEPQQLMRVAYLLAVGVRPHVIVNVDGYNELALAAHNASMGEDELFPHWTRWGHLTAWDRDDPEALERAAGIHRLKARVRGIAGAVERFGLHRSALLGSAALALVRSQRREWGGRQEAYAAHLGRRSREAFEERAPPLGGVLERSVRGWAESSRLIDALCRSAGVRYVHVLQPTLHDEGSKIVAPEEARRGVEEPYRREAVRLGYPMLREEGERLAAEGIAFADLSRIFEGDDRPFYFDSCHFGGEGMRMFGAAVARAVLAALPPE